jgi:oxygen-dependent protoporphyrinogen oxidase
MNPQPTSPRIAVIGGGITGLTAAWKLRAAGLAPVVFERASRTGGAIGAMRSDGWLHELGPNSLLEGSAEVAAFIDEIGLGARRLYAGPEAKQRYIVRGGQLHAAPTSPLGFLRTRLFSWPAKLKLAGEPWRARADAAAEESVADFVVRRLGREFLDYAVNPFVGGVYAGDPARLSVRHAFPKLHQIEQQHGSLIRGALARRNTSGGPKGRIFSFPEGLGEITDTLRDALRGSVRMDTAVQALRRESDGTWRVAFAHAGTVATEAFDAIVCALPADALAALVVEGEVDAAVTRSLGELRQIEHPAVVSVFFGYRRAEVAHPLDGFGALVPAVERAAILGTLFSSTLFPGRAPEGHVALTTFVGGVRNPEIAALADEALIDTVQRELQRLLGVQAPPCFVHLQRWRRAIPQYTLGYQRFKDAILSAERAAPGLFIGGNARDGIALSNCIASGTRLAAAVSDWHAARRTAAPLAQR